MIENDLQLLEDFLAVFGKKERPFAAGDMDTQALMAAVDQLLKGELSQEQTDELFADIVDDEEAMAFLAKCLEKGEVA